MLQKNFAIIFATVLLSGCATVFPGKEPEWSPPMYKYSRIPKCEFVAHEEAPIGCEDLELYEYSLIHDEALIDLDIKFGQCEKWR